MVPSIAAGVALGPNKSTVRGPENTVRPTEMGQKPLVCELRLKSVLVRTRLTNNRISENLRRTNQSGSLQLCCKVARTSILFTVPVSFMVSLYVFSIYTAYLIC
jgi:hypothetical protein